MATTEALRALIIGTGSIGQRHMHNLQTIAPNTEFLLLRRSAEPLAGWPGTKVAPDLDSALAFAPDFAILATPSAHHFSFLKGLISAKVPTYVEKPVVTDLDQVNGILAALQAHPGVPHVAGFNLRLLPSLSRALEITSAGRLGDIARASFSAGQWLPDWRKGQNHREGYSARVADGGGVLLDLSHEFDAARLLLGEMKILFAAKANVAALEIESEGAAVATARATSGALISVNLDYVARQPVRCYELVGTEGALTWDLPAKVLTLTSVDGRRELSSNPADFDVGATYVTAMTNFLGGVLSGIPGPMQSLEDGLRSTELAIRAHRKDFSN